jgi:ECF sigma factor
MTDVTQILNAIEHDDPHAAEQLLPLVYDELRRLAAEKMAQEKPGLRQLEEQLRRTERERDILKKP